MTVTLRLRNFWLQFCILWYVLEWKFTFYPIFTYNESCEDAIPDYPNSFITSPVKLTFTLASSFKTYTFFSHMMHKLVIQQMCWSKIRFLHLWVYDIHIYIFLKKDPEISNFIYFKHENENWILNKTLIRKQICVFNAKNSNSLASYLKILNKFLK